MEPPAYSSWSNNDWRHVRRPLFSRNLHTTGQKIPKLSEFFYIFEINRSFRWSQKYNRIRIILETFVLLCGVWIQFFLRETRIVNLRYYYNWVPDYRETLYSLSKICSQRSAGSTCFFCMFSGYACLYEWYKSSILYHKKRSEGKFELLYALESPKRHFGTDLANI